MRRRDCLLAGGSAMLLGCTSTSHDMRPGLVQPSSHVPTPDAPRRSVGLLRRLVVLPVALEFTPKDPRECFERCDPQGLLRALANAVPRGLQRHRGYEVVSMDPNFESDPATATIEPTPALPAGQVGTWRDTLLRRAQADSDDPPPTELRHAVQALAALTRADGIVLLHGTMVYDTKTDWLLGYLTFSLSLGLMFARWGLRLQADIFEAASGSLVWRGRYAEKSGIVAADGADPIVTALFDGLEPALPRLFTTPR